MEIPIMSKWDAMRMADVMTVAEAACCIVGIPTTMLGTNTSTDPYLRSDMELGNVFDDGRDVFCRVVDLLRNSIMAEKLQAIKIYAGKYHHVRMVGDESDGYWEPVGQIDAWKTLIDVDDLKKWLESRNLRPAFFFPPTPSASDEPEYLDPNHPRYAPKLAAAVRAWEAVTDPGSRRTPKQALDKWLREHGAAYGLTDDEGKAKETAIEEISKVANWNPNGGVPKTP